MTSRPASSTGTTGASGTGGSGTGTGTSGSGATGTDAATQDAPEPGAVSGATPGLPRDVVDGRPSRARRVVTMLSPYLFVLAVLVALVLPRLMGEAFFGWGLALTFTAAYVLYATSWDIVSGFTGQVNFGHSAFIGVGGFAAAIFVAELGWDLWLVILAATVVAALLGLVIGVPALRLTGPYLALVTLTVVTALTQVQLALKDVTGGEEGIVGLPRLVDDPLIGPVGTAVASLTLGPATFDDATTLDQDLYVDYAVVVLTCALMVGGLLLLGYSRRGLVLRSVQQDPVAAEAAGVQVRRYKVAAFTLSGALGGLAGGLVVAIRGNANPDLLFVNLSLLVIVMAALGGLGTIVGPAVGAVVVGLLDFKLLDEIGTVRANPELKIGLFALVLILVVILQPRGLLPPLQQRWRARLAERNRTQIGAGLASVLSVPPGADAGGGGQEGDASREGADPGGERQAEGVERG